MRKLKTSRLTKHVFPLEAFSRQANPQNTPETNRGSRRQANYARLEEVALDLDL
jgi:hypothetical protein